MKSRILLCAAMMVALSTGLLGTAGIASAHTLSTRPMAYTCTGGDFASGNLTNIPSGTYTSIKVKGACAVADGAVIRVLGNVDVAPGAVLDAQSAPSTITVGQDVTAAKGAILGLGCLPNPPGHTTGHPCTIDPTGSSAITVKGSIIAKDADTVLLNGITVKGNVTLIGGGEDVIPWSIKANTIRGNLVVIGVTPNWIGVIVNKVGGNVILLHITITDPGDPSPTIFVASNTIRRNLVCFGLAPAVSGGFPGEVNVVGGHAIGQCANLQNETPGA
jgi:hypothetical protein